jgi:hypothetical protein
VTTRQFVVIALQLWLPTATMFMLVMNMALESWGLRPLLAILVRLLALLVPGFATASLLLRRASRHAGRDEAVLIANRSGSGTAAAAPHATNSRKWQHRRATAASYFAE